MNMNHQGLRHLDGRAERVSGELLTVFQGREAEVRILAQTIWGEARGEPVSGQEAVACVVINRVRLPRWWGRSVTEVCQKPGQFSCWNADDPNRGKLDMLSHDDPAFATALRIARRALAGVLADPTRGATHYHALAVSPRWARRHAPSAQIGNHVFYNDIEVCT